MTKDEFLQFVKNAQFLGPDRQKDIIDNVDWMTDAELDFLVKSISETGTKLEKNNQKILQELTRIEEAFKSFRKEEIPKIAKEEEAKAAKGEKEAAEKLIKEI